MFKSCFYKKLIEKSFFKNYNNFILLNIKKLIIITKIQKSILVL